MSVYVTTEVTCCGDCPDGKTDICCGSGDKRKIEDWTIIPDWCPAREEEEITPKSDNGDLE